MKRKRVLTNARRQTKSERETSHTLRERVKELTCLYGIAQVVEKCSRSPEQALQGMVELIPPAWQYPEITAARICLDGDSYATPGFSEKGQKQAAEILVGGQSRGVVEVVYRKKKPPADEGPFLKEERSLLSAIAKQVSLVIERHEAEAERAKLGRELRHADRLATIGQLVAGVAHELNEPLGNILGFAQLAKKGPGLPGQTALDLGKIVTASLYAREIIRKLLLFARQTPVTRTRVSLNAVIGDALGLFEHRLAREGIELVQELCPALPEITADPAQLTQVFVNLIVNAIQAMPRGGRLIVRTCPREQGVTCVVEDTGIGMSEEILDRVFLPFFTTKDVNQGTGLGLSVVHGIVTSHGGAIKAQSSPGQGSRFEICLPTDGPSGQHPTAPHERDR